MRFIGWWSLHQDNIVHAAAAVDAIKTMWKSQAEWDNIAARGASNLGLLGHPIISARAPITKRRNSIAIHMISLVCTLVTLGAVSSQRRNLVDLEIITYCRTFYWEFKQKNALILVTAITFLDTFTFDGNYWWSRSRPIWFFTNQNI